MLILPLAGGSVGLVLRDARVGASVQAGGPAGVKAKNGVIGGALHRPDLDVAFATLDNECAGGGGPAFCSYLGVVESFLPSLADIDTDGDGVKDALSMCFLFTLGPVKINGYL